MLATYALSIAGYNLVIDDEVCLDTDNKIDYYKDSVEQITEKLLDRAGERMINACVLVE